MAKQLAAGSRAILGNFQFYLKKIREALSVRLYIFGKAFNHFAGKIS